MLHRWRTTQLHLPGFRKLQQDRLLAEDKRLREKKAQSEELARKKSELDSYLLENPALKLQKDNQKKKADASIDAEKMRKVEWHKDHPHENAPKKINERHIYC